MLPAIIAPAYSPSAERDLLDAQDRIVLIDKDIAASPTLFKPTEIRTYLGLKSEYEDIINQLQTQSSNTEKRARDLCWRMTAVRNRFRKIVAAASLAVAEPDLTLCQATISLGDNEKSLRSIQEAEVWYQSGLIDAGGYGVVHLGLAPQLGRMVILKSNKKARHGRGPKLLLREREIWETLEHPSILPYYGECLIQGTTFIVSPYAESGTLREFFICNPAADRTPLIKELASAMEYLHSRNIIHGDLNGQNVLVTDAHRIWLCDFGFSKRLGDSSSEGSQGAGTFYWQSPERLEAGRYRTKEDDVYGFGMTIAEVLLGEVPFEGSSVAKLYVMVIRDNVRPEHGEGMLWNVARRCWEQVAADRPAFPQICQDLTA